MCEFNFFGPDLSSCCLAHLEKVHSTMKLDVPWLLWWPTRWLNIKIFHHAVGTHLLTDIICLWQIFHSVAYKAKDRNDLLSGIDEFLDQVTVLPPGEWDPSIRIKPPKSVPSQVRLLLWPEAASLCLVWVRRVQHCLSLQEKRKMASISTGSAYASDIIREADHHTGPELQRTGRSVEMEGKRSFKCSFYVILSFMKIRAAFKSSF